MVDLSYRQHRTILAMLKIVVIVSLAFLFSWLVANYVGWEVPTPGLYGAAGMAIAAMSGERAAA